MKGTTTKNFKRIQDAHSRLHDVEISENPVTLIPTETNTADNLLATEENPKQFCLPNVVFLGFKETIKNKAYRSAASNKDAKNRDISDGRLETSLEDQYLTLSGYFDRLYLLKLVNDFSPDAEMPGQFESSSEDIPKIDVVPPPSQEIEMFSTCAFCFDSPAEETVELIWQSSDKETLQRAAMDSHSAGNYICSVLLDYGSYRFAYKIGNVTFPSFTHAQKLRLQSNGIFAFFENKKSKLVVPLRNTNNKAQLVSLTTDALWLRPVKIMLQPLQKTYAVIDILPENLKLGINEADINVIAVQGTNNKQIKSFPVKVKSVTEAVIPFLHCRQLNNKKGKNNEAAASRFVIDVSTQGEGSLTGLLLLPQLGEQVDFQIKEEDTERSYSYTFSLSPEKLYLCGNELTVILITDCYLANMRVQLTAVPFQIIYLKKSLPSLTFGELPYGRTQTLHLTVRRSDEKEFYLKTFIPRHAEKYLSVFRRNSNAFSFHFDTRNLKPGAVINDIVMLKDEDSGLQNEIKVIAKVTNA